MKEIKKILVINRLSQYTRDALLSGLALAKCFGAELSIMRIVTNPVDMEAINAPDLSLEKDLYDHESLQEQYKAELHKEIMSATGGTIPVQEMVVDRNPVPEVVRVVGQEEIDLIVILAHEEWRLEHLLFGGENDELIRRLPCSVFLVKHEPQPA